MKSFKLNELMRIHIDYLLSNEEIESSCAVSSQLLGSYFYNHGWKIIYGSYGHHNFFHSWIETPEGILDPTRFQFLTNKKEIIKYKTRTGYDHYILSVQGGWSFDVSDSNFKKIAEIQPLFPSLPGADYQDYLDEVKSLNSYQTFNWRQSKLKEESVVFIEHLKSNGKRIGKKHFRRFAVCSL